MSRAAPYVSDAVAGYLTDGVAGAVARPAARAARELLPDAFTNNRAKTCNDPVFPHYVVH